MIVKPNSDRKYLFHEIRIQAKPAEIFSLLCPVREYEWIPDWICEVLYTESGYAEDNCIFETPFHETGGKDLWIVSHYQPAQSIQFIRVNEWRIIRYNISLQCFEDESTLIHWEQVVTSRGEEGSRWMQSYTQEQFSSLIEKLGNLLENWLSSNR